MKQKNLNLNKNLENFIEEFPETKDVFELFGINYENFAKGNIPEIAKEKNIKLDDLVFSLNEKIFQKSHSLENKSLSEIISYIEKTHHAFLWEKLPSTDMLLDSIIKIHGKKHGEFLLGLKKIFGTIKNSLENHLENEEYDLFAIVKEVEKHPRKKKKISKEDVISKITSLYEDHDKTKKLLAQMRSFTNEYEAPEYACEKFKQMYENLKAMEDDLHEHIYVENAILMPKIKNLLT